MAVLLVATLSCLVMASAQLTGGFGPGSSSTASVGGTRFTLFDFEGGQRGGRFFCCAFRHGFLSFDVCCALGCALALWTLTPMYDRRAGGGGVPVRWKRAPRRASSQGPQGRVEGVVGPHSCAAVRHVYVQRLRLLPASRLRGPALWWGAAPVPGDRLHCVYQGRTREQGAHCAVAVSRAFGLTGPDLRDDASAAPVRLLAEHHRHEPIPSGGQTEHGVLG